MPLTLRRAAAIGLGAVAGASLRWLAGDLIDPIGDLPVATMLVNIVGAALLAGILTRDPSTGHENGQALRSDALSAGFCGALTTMSAFAVETAALLDGGEPATAGLYVALTVGLGLVAAVTTRGLLGPTTPGTERC